MNAENPPGVEFNHASGEEITVWVGAPSFVAGLPSWGRLLIVEADHAKARELREVLKENIKAQVCEEVLTAESGDIVQWHRFNDMRLNGPSDLMTWQPQFRNLRQIDEEQRYGRSLVELLDNWAPQEGGQTVAPLHLILRQGDPLAALMGLGQWIGHLETVQLMLPWPEATMQVVETWLIEKNFNKDPQSKNTWERHPLTRRDLLLKEKENEKRFLHDANQRLNRDLEVIQTEKSLLEENLTYLSAEFEELKKAQDLTQAGLSQCQAEAEQQRSEGERLKLVCQQLETEKSELVQKVEALETANLNSLQSLLRLFPMEIYKEKNTDLCGHDERQILQHYLEHGLHDIELRSYNELDKDLKASLNQCEKAETKLVRLEAQFDLVQQQLETLKDLFARLTDKKQTPRKAKKK